MLKSHATIKMYPSQLMFRYHQRSRGFHVITIDKSTLERGFWTKRRGIKKHG